MARRHRTKRHTVDEVAVIGLGRFGQALAVELERSGTQVLGIDTDEDTVQSLNGVLTQVVRADSTRDEVLAQLDIDSFDRVVLAIGTDLEASILTASLLRRRGKAEIWAKAVSEQHGLILEQLGVHHVVYPEADMGRRVAHLVQSSMIDYVALDTDFVVAVTRTPDAAAHTPLGDAGLRARHDVTVIAVKRDGRWQPVEADQVLQPGELIAVVGATQQTERFCRLA